MASPRLRPVSAEDRARILDAWESSGLAAAAFAPQAGVTAHTLYVWRRKARSRAVSDPAVPRFIEAVVRPRTQRSAASAEHVPATSAMVELVLGDVLLRVGPDVEAAHLHRVLEIVRSAAS